MNILDEVYTIQEAAEAWGVTDNSLKQNCMGRVKGEKALQPNEFKKSGRAWLVTRQAMIRLYGEPPRKE